ncbi:MAG: hypothetical protein ABIT16_09255 [Croceibacterium sp.]
MRRLALLAAAPLAAAAFAAAPAAAQNAPSGNDKFNTVIIYGDDACPASAEGEIVVCARMDESERFRIPEALRQSESPANNSWTNRVKSFETVGNFGPLSCSPIGLGGELGCTAQMIESAYEEKRHGSDVRFSQLIDQARAERMATVDQEAADTQARVEVLERQYMERLEREREAEGDTAEAPKPASPVRTVDPLAVPPQP